MPWEIITCYYKIPLDRKIGVFLFVLLIFFDVRGYYEVFWTKNFTWDWQICKE